MTLPTESGHGDRHEMLALLRGLAGSSVRGEKYLKAEIVAGRVGRDQTPPRREFD